MDAHHIVKEVSAVFAQQKYSYAYMFNRPLKISRAGILFADMPVVREGFYDCGVANWTLFSRLAENGFPAELVQGDDMFGIFDKGGHIFVRCRDEIYDATGIFPEVGSAHTVKNTLDPDETRESIERTAYSLLSPASVYIMTAFPQHRGATFLRVDYTPPEQLFGMGRGNKPQVKKMDWVYRGEGKEQSLDLTSLLSANVSQEHIPQMTIDEIRESPLNNIFSTDTEPILAAVYAMRRLLLSEYLR